MDQEKQLRAQIKVQQSINDNLQKMSNNMSQTLKNVQYAYKVLQQVQQNKQPAQTFGKLVTKIEREVIQYE